MLEHFWKLVSSEAEERRQAELNLLKAVLDSQDKHEGEDPSPDADYALKRLVRGLSSSTEAARQGFASCLAEMLHLMPQIKLDVVIDHMHKSTEITGSVRGQEARDFLFGRIFTCLAVARSERLLAKGKDKEAVQKAGLELFDVVLDIFSRKKVLKSMAGEAVVAIMRQMPPEVFVSELAEKLGAAVGGAEASVREILPEQLFLALAIQQYLAQHGLKKSEGLKGRLPDWVLSKALLKPSRVGKLLEVFKASSGAFPQVHPVWGLVLQEVRDGEEGEALLASLWNEIVDQGLANGTHERKALSLFLLQRVTAGLSASGLTIVLTPQTLKLLISALSTAGSSDQLLAPLAKQTLQVLVDNVKEDGAKRLAVASTLLSRGDVNFDKKTRTSTVQDLLSNMDGASLLTYVRSLADAASDHGNGDATLDRRLWAVDALYALSKHPSVTSDVAMTLVVLRLLLALAYFDATGVPGSSAPAETSGKKDKKKDKRKSKQADAADWVLVRTSVPKEVREVAATRFQSFVADLSRVQAPTPQPEGGKKAKGAKDDDKEDKENGAPLNNSHAHGRAPSVLEGLTSLWAVHEAWEGLEGAGATLVKGLSKADEGARKEMLAICKGVREELASADAAKPSEKQRMGGALACLLMHVGVAQLGEASGEEEEEEEEEEEGEGESLLRDLCTCYRDLMGGKKASRKDGDVDPLAVLADGCVSLLLASGDGATVRGLRDVSKRAWGAVCGSTPLTAAALSVLVSVVCGEAEDKEEEEDGEEGQGHGSDSDDDEASEEEEEEGEEEEEDEDEEEDKMEVETPRKGGKKAGCASSDDDDDEEGDTEMVGGDELMEVLTGAKDPEGAERAFAAMMALRKEARQGSKNDRVERERAGLQHRLRVLDLLEATVGKQPQSPLLLTTLPPCVAAIRRLTSTAEAGKPNEHRALLRRLSDFITKKLPKARPRDVSSDDLQAMATSLVQDLNKAPTAAQVTLLASALSLVTRTALSGAATGPSDKCPKWLCDVYKQCLDGFMTKRGGLTAAPFEQLILRFPGPAAQLLLPPLLGYTTSAHKAFLQCEAFRLAGMLVRQRKAIPAGPTREGVYAQLPALLDAATAVLSSSEENEKDKLKAKRIKPIMDCCMEVAVALGDKDIAKGTSKAANQAITTLSEALKKTQASTASDPLKKTCSTLINKLVQVSGGAATSAPAVNGGKPEKKRKKDEFVVPEAESEPVAENGGKGKKAKKKKKEAEA